MRIRKLLKTSIILIAVLCISFQVSLAAPNSALAVLDYEILSKTTYTPPTFYPIDDIKYIDEQANRIVNVQLIVFNDSELDNWITAKTNTARNAISIDEDVIFVSSDNKYVFWRSGQTYVKVTEKYPHSTKDAPFDFLTSTGTMNIDTQLISEYLTQYPSDCTENNCLIGLILDKEDFSFKGVRELEHKVRDYTQAFLSCPNRNPSKADIKASLQEGLASPDRFNDAEISAMISECQGDDFEAFTVPLNDKSGFIKECESKLKSRLSEQNITDYREDYVLRECVIQEDFTERYSEDIKDADNSEFFNDLLDSRMRSAANEIKAKYAGHEATEEDDEEAYLQKVEQQRLEDDPSTFNESADYTIDTFPEYTSETTENFLQRFLNFFKRVFNIFEWQDMKEEKRIKP
ncbi:MAG: hypothetical protein ABIH76_08885 [Candidatus Bathyarchaeota archaeon]